ncbi:AlbA family DNA-binding domain-containing protein [Faecalibacter macacae]|uniref:Schlafen AlbA-2 domain-containing protein n=1 Tax=Faecalibacter macacae TaxID=1859289 RepID=A0A3L9MGL1_9FLAO|nr:ATP-binding protein [Faecalibacter macacae]RLZ10454.1 hypothetical protein EAH69_06590 [Faecalibacter macacae]
MTNQEIENILSKGEGTRIEFKKCDDGKVPRSIYDTICSFLNKEGGVILAGVDDNGDVNGIPEDKLSSFITTVSTTVNNPSTIIHQYLFHLFLISIRRKILLLSN